MSQIRLVGKKTDSLYERIGFDRRLEEDAFRRLADLDLNGCRTRFGKLVEGLDLRHSPGQPPEAALLLLDLLQRVNQLVNRTGAESGAYHEIRLELISRFSSFGSAEEARAAFMPALNRILSPLARGTSSRNLIDRARGFIEENYHRRLSLSMVSAKLNVSPNYLSRIFRKETGETLTTYIQKVRLKHAMLMLAEGGRSISEIAYMVGYQNYRDFYRNFVKYENASPRQVQRRLLP